MATLVTGGAGYIGSHVVWTFVDRGEAVVVLDNLSTGVRGLVAPHAHFVEGDAGDSALVRRLVADFGIDAIVHFAGSIALPDSIADPLACYASNVVVAHKLIEAAVAAGVKHVIFSSTAAVYAGASPQPLTETSPLAPGGPYGRSKLMTEWILEDCARAYDLRYTALRYFNVAGADGQGRSGQSTPRAIYLIRRACQVALEHAPCLEIFGTDYPTPDGTVMRDYIHVSDLAEAHGLALDYLRGGGAACVMNCGYGRGVSVRDIVAAVERVAGRKLPVRESARRAGDSAWLVCDPTRIKATLSWVPSHDDLDEIVRTTYDWESRFNSR